MVVRLLRVLAIVWMAAIATRYIDTVQKSLQNPFNDGAELQSTVVLLAFIAVFAGSLAWNRAVAFRIWTEALASAAVVMLILSGSFVPALIALWVAAAAMLLGDRVLVKLRLDSWDNICDRFVIAFPIGIAGIGTVAFALALLGLFNSMVAWIVLLAVTLVESRHALRLARDFSGRVRRREKFFAVVPEAPFLILLMEFAVVRNLTWAVAPEIEFDALNMRLTVPKIFLAEGRFVDLPNLWHSYFVHLLEYFHGFCMALQSEAAAKLAVAVIGIAAAFTVYSLGRLVFSPAVGLWAAAFFYMTPLVSWGTGTAYNDNAVALFLTASLIAFLLWYRSQHPGWMIVSGLLAGGAIAIKVNAAYAVLPLGIALLILVASRGTSVGQRFQAVASFAILVCVVAVPWYLVVYILTGNPVFPLMNGIFRSPFWDLNNTLMNAATFGVGTSPAALLRLPFRITLDTTRFGEGLARGGLGPLLLVFIPFGFLRLRENREARIVTFVVCVYLVLWAYTFQYGRYYTAILPGIVILAVGGLLLAATGFYERFKRLVLGGYLIAQMALLPVLYWRIPERFPIYLALGMEGRESFLLRSVPGYGAAQYLNASVRQGEKVLSIGFEGVRFYLKPPLATYVESRTPGVLSHAVRLAPGKELATLLLENNLTYVFLTPQDLSKRPPDYPWAEPEFLREYATPVYADEEARVFRLKR